MGRVLSRTRIMTDLPTIKPMPSRDQAAVRSENGVPQPVTDALVVEEPLQINLNGKPFSVTMRTPGHDPELVKGLLLTEGIVDLDGLGIEVPLEIRDGYTVASVTVPPMYLCENLHEKRSLIANASCGFCGKREISDLRPARSTPIREETLEARLIPGLGQQMRERQGGFEVTGGCHAAAAFTIDGTHLAQFEDIGRHNAVDKVIGSLVTARLLDQAAVLQVSGRVSFEIVSKAAVAGLPFICAVSAPSSLAVDLAEEAGIALVAFCRDNRFTVYSHRQRIQFGESNHEQR